MKWLKATLKATLAGLFCASSYRFIEGLNWQLSIISTADPQFIQKLEFSDERMEAIDLTLKVYPDVESLRVVRFHDIPKSSRFNPQLFREGWVLKNLEMNVALENPCQSQTRDEVAQSTDKFALSHWHNQFFRSPILEYSLGEQYWTQIVKEARTTPNSLEKDPNCQPAPHARLYSEILKEKIEKNKNTLKHYRHPMSAKGTEAAGCIAAGSLVALGVTACFSRERKEERREGYHPSTSRAEEMDQPGAAPLSLEQKLHNKIAEYREQRRGRRSPSPA